MTDAEVKVESSDGSVRVTLVGDVDLANAADIARAVNAAITNQVTSAVIDLTDVGYLDSAGLRVLFGLASRLPLLQIALELVAPPGSPARRVVDMSGLSQLVPVLPPR